MDADPGGAGDRAVPTVDELAESLVERVTKPRRRREPRLAGPLAGIERVMVPTSHGAVAAWRAGDGPATLLAHGWEDDSTLWEPVMGALLDRSMPFVAFDLPAHGFSEGTRGMLFEAADAIHAVTPALGPIRSLVAHSFAGNAAAIAVAEGHPAGRVVLVAPPLWPVGAGRFHRVAAQLGLSTEVAERARSIYRQSTDPDRADIDIRTQLSELDVDLLLVSSVDDERVAVADARALAPQLRRGTLFEVHGADHRETARHPDVVRRIVEFLDPEPVAPA